jgi:DNA-binding NarL/FixJ family response regulator
MKKYVVDVEKGTEGFVDMTLEEIEQLSKDQAEGALFIESIQKELQTRQSAISKLAALGLTEEEIASLRV